jgi:crossover junction endodeoxyribonuclease RuvC
MTWLACDPGLTGAFALSTDDSFQVRDMMTFADDKGKRHIAAADLLKFLRLLREGGVHRFVIEQVGGAPGQSAPASFNFGYGVGLVEGLAIGQGYAIERVAPVVWKRAMKCPSDKQAARARASELLPAFAHLWPLKSHHGRAEAAMLALYAERFLK